MSSFSPDATFRTRPKIKSRSSIIPISSAQQTRCSVLDYSQFVRGCHLGIFPSYYEPWGYTPLECMASGVPSVTSDLSGFGDYLLKHFPDHNKHGCMWWNAASVRSTGVRGQLSGFLYQFLMQTRRERITQRNHVENYSAAFDWENLIVHYQNVYDSLVDPDT
ncbi:MAG: glycosyltransferase [Bacteroidota bacterium]